MTIKQAKIFRGDKCGEDNSLGYHALKSEIRELKKQYKFCDELVDELKVDGYKYLQGRICDIHDENKNMLGFDRGKAPTEEEIEDQIFAAQAVLGRRHVGRQTGGLSDAVHLS